MILPLNHLQVGFKILDWSSNLTYSENILGFNFLIIIIFVLDSNANSHLMALLTECALHLTKDGDKVNLLNGNTSFSFIHYLLLMVLDILLTSFSIWLCISRQ